jgi:signal transduction histidine kinase
MKEERTRAVTPEHEALDSAATSRARTRHIQVLRAVAEAVSQSLNVDEVLDRALIALTHVTGHEISSLHLLSVEGDQLLLKGDRGLSPWLREVNLVLTVGRGLIGTVALTGIPRRFDDVTTAPDLLPEARAAVGRANVRAFVCVPIRARRRILGTLSLGRQTGRRFSDHDVMLLECAADQIGLALDNARLYGETRRQLDELERARAAVVRAERLSAVGELAAGVAHEINNPLTIVLAQTHLLNQEAMPPSVADGLRTIEVAARRAAGIVKDLVQFATPRVVRRNPCDLAEVAARILALHAERFQSDHVLARLQVEEVPPVWCDAEQIKQVLVNVIENARFALTTERGGGNLEVRIAPSQFGVTISVADDGPGIAPEHLPRIFTPFFTTKGPDQGRGLGLSVAYGIVREHGGRLWADNGPNGGAVLNIELPISLRRGDRSRD